MHSSANDLFRPAANYASILRTFGLVPSPEQLQIHAALVSRTLKPSESALRQASSWLGVLFEHLGDENRVDSQGLLSLLDEKSCLIHRLSYRHAPAIAQELESTFSPLYALDSATRHLPVHRDTHSAALARLREEISGHMLPDRPPAEADPTWHENRRQLQQLILQDNPDRFLTWPVIINSMFMNDSTIAGPELAALQEQPDFTSRWWPAIREDALGAPFRAPLHPESSNNLIHHAYNLLQLELQGNTRIDELSSILEFGGGYGSTARLAFRLGFAGKYVIFDLPEFAALQRFYLGSLGFPVDQSIRWASDHLQLAELIPRPDLFLATWSLSETPLGFREQLRPSILAAPHILVAYQDAFGGADNLRYFSDLRRSMPEKAVFDYPIQHLGGNRYFVAAPPSAGTPA